jgi:hypothetical protein
MQQLDRYPVPSASLRLVKRFVRRAVQGMKVGCLLGPCYPYARRYRATGNNRTMIVAAYSAAEQFCKTHERDIFHSGDQHGELFAA